MKTFLAKRFQLSVLLFVFSVFVSFGQVVGTPSVTQASTADVIPGSTNQEVIKIEVVVGATSVTLESVRIKFNTVQSSSDYGTAHIYYTGTTNTFSPSSEFANLSNGGAFITSAAFNMNGTQLLSANNTHYIWLAFDVSSGATVGNYIDCNIRKIVVDGTDYILETQNPVGERYIISNYPPPDTPCEATPLIVGCAGSKITGDNTGMTDSGIASPSCGSYSGGDMWYKLVVPPSGNLKIETYPLGLTDVAMATYTSTTDCNGSLTELLCDDNSGFGDMAKIMLFCQNPGDTVYIRVWDNNNDETGTFEIDASDLDVHYCVSGDSQDLGNGCAQLTDAVNGQNGAVWDANNKLDFTNDWSYDFKVNLGTDDAGADGICFVIQNDPNGLSTVSGGDGVQIGAGGINNSLIVEIDTYLNDEDRNDGIANVVCSAGPDPDHLDIWLNGDIEPAGGGCTDGVVSGTRYIPNAEALINGGADYNIENGLDHTFRVSFNSATGLFTAEVLDDAGVTSYGLVSYTITDVMALFGTNAPYFGLTASTGGMHNAQSVCLPIDYDIPTNTITYTHQDCSCGANDGTITITGNPVLLPNENYEVSYDFGGTTFSSTITTNASGEIILSGLSAGDYTNFIVNHPTICPITDNTTITLISAIVPTVAISGNADICQGTSTDLIFIFTGIPPYDFTYSDGTNSYNITGINTSPYTISVSPVSTTTYTVTSFNDANCTGTISGSAIISVHEPVTVNNIQSLCNASQLDYNVTFDISGGDAGSYIVTPAGSGSLSGNSFTSNAITSGTAYSFTVTDQWGCSPVTVNGTQSCDCPITASISGDASICTGTSTNLTFTFAGGSFPYNFTYSDGTTNINATANTSPLTISVSPTSTTTYTLVSVNDASCSGTASGSATITINLLDDAGFSLTDFCEGASNSATITGTTGGTFAFNPVPSNGETVNSTTGEITGGIGGTTYTLEYTTSAACPASSTQNVSVIALDDASFTLTDFCEGASNSATITGTTGGTFSFNPAPTNGETVNSTTGEITGGIGGTTYTLEYTTSGACPASSTQNVTVNALPTFTVSGTNPTSCGGTDGTITITGLLGSTTYNVSYDDNGSSQGPNSMTSDASGNIIINNLTAGSYTNFVVSLNGCSTTDNSTITLTEPNAPAVNAGTDLTGVCLGSPVTLTATVTPTTATISWSDNIQDGQAFTPTSAGTFTYTVTATENGCTSTDQVTVEVVVCCDAESGTWN